MDITISRDVLLKPLQAISGVVEKKQTMPILANVLLTIKNNQLLLTATDMEIELIGCVHLLSLTTIGSTTVSAKKLFDICRALPEGSALRLTLEKNYLVVRTGESCFMLNILPPQDFPSLENSDYPIQFNLKQSVFKNLLAKTYFAMAQQDVRHYLNGTFLDIAEKTIRSVAADGHRLAVTTIHDEGIVKVNARVILPRKSVLELMRLLGDHDQEVTIFIADKRFRVATSDYIFTSKLINAQYPDYNRLIPQGNMVAIGDRESLKQAFTRASILSNEKFRGVRCELYDNKMTITANNSDQEQAEEVVALDYTGDKIEIGFNVAYLVDVVSAIAGKRLRCAFKGPNDGVLIEAEDGDDSIYVVMPMRL